jgi:hypothetical protein
VGGRKNEELLDLATPQFDVLLTLDKNVPFQQDRGKSRLSYCVFARAGSSLATLEHIGAGQVVRVGSVRPTG